VTFFRLFYSSAYEIFIRIRSVDKCNYFETLAGTLADKAPKENLQLLGA